MADIARMSGGSVGRCRGCGKGIKPGLYIQDFTERQSGDYHVQCAVDAELGLPKVWWVKPRDETSPKILESMESVEGVSFSIGSEGSQLLVYFGEKLIAKCNTKEYASIAVLDYVKRNELPFKLTASQEAQPGDDDMAKKASKTVKKAAPKKAVSVPKAKAKQAVPAKKEAAKKTFLTKPASKAMAKPASTSKPANSDTPNIALTPAEYKAAVEGTLKPREVPGRKDQDTLDPKAKSADGRAYGRPLGVSTGLPIAGVWCLLFAKNQHQMKKDRMTDKEISAFMHKEFPGRSTTAFDRVHPYRLFYNKGRFTKGVKPKVQSTAFDNNGDSIPLVVRGPYNMAKKTVAKKPAAKETVKSPRQHAASFKRKAAKAKPASKPTAKPKPEAKPAAKPSSSPVKKSFLVKR